MWECPACGKSFQKREQWHSCAVVPLSHHFEGRPEAKEPFDAWLELLERECGAFRLSVARTRIGIVTRITFGAVEVRRRHLRAHLLLPRWVDSPRFVKVEHMPPWYVHVFELRDAADLDEELAGWARESYAAALGS